MRWTLGGVFMRRQLVVFVLDLVVSLMLNPAHAQNAATTSAVWHECEDTAGCSLWIFTGDQGQGKWSNGSIANLRIEKLNASEVSITRNDLSGTVAGLRAVYSGTRTGNYLAGTVTWSWPGHGQFSSGITNWHATLPDKTTSLPLDEAGRATAGAKPLPGALLECEGDQCARGGGGALWVFDGLRGEAMWRYGAVADLTIEKFDGHTIALSRADPPGTYSSRWAGPDGYFRARYTGTIQGSRIDGLVYFNGDTSHPGTWFATVAQAPCGAGTACPLTLDQVRQLKDRAQSAQLLEAASLCSKIVSSQEAANTATGAPPSDTANICGSQQIRAAMQIVEDQEVHDPTGMLLGAAVCGITGVCGDAEHPENLQPTILESRPARDSAGYTSNDPGSFLCQGLFARGNVHLVVGESGDLSSDLTKEEMDKVLQKLPNFVESFKVRPLQNGQYILILIPGITGLSQPYSSRFSYP
jgi:hypothetical protein